MTTELITMPVTSLSTATVEFSFDNIADQLFKKVQNCVYDLRTGRLGVLRASQDSYAVFVPGEEDGKGEEGGKGGKGRKKPQIQVCPVTAFGLPIPAFAIRTTLSNLTPGDVVIVPGQSSDTWLYYLEHDLDNKDIQNPIVSGIRVEDGVKTEITLSESMFVAGDSVLCVKNMIGKQTELTKMLPLLALMGAGGKGEEGKEKFSKLILCMLMGQGGGLSGEGFDMKSMLPMMMLGNGGGGDSMLMAMLLQSGGLSGHQTRETGHRS